MHDAMTMRMWILWIVVLALIVTAGVAVLQRGAITGWVLERPYRTALPDAQPAVVFSPLPFEAATVPSPTSAPAPIVREVPPSPPSLPAVDAINLDVPFASQAPFANWVQPYQDACEEATIIMIERYLRGASLTLQEMDTEILRMVDLQQDRYGFFRDSNVAETVRLAEASYPDITARAVYDITAEDIRAALAGGTPVLVLVNGQKIGNPFYTFPGPERHTLVIKGVTGNTFITNDPGTRRGADFAYPIDTVMNALVDYDGGTPGTGKRAMILLSLTD